MFHPPRLIPGWPRLVLLVLPPLALAAIAAGFYLTSRPVSPGAAVTQAAAPDVAAAVPKSSGLLVQVSGAVKQPGLYRLAKGERVYAAIAVAGGLTAEADPERLPALAARLKDGQQVKVPARSATTSSRTSGGARSTSGSGSRSSGSVAKTDLNNATADELTAVPGFSPELAAAVVNYRDQYGAFTNLKQLVTLLAMSLDAYKQAKPHLHL
ncbi:MAG: helix-hairpin-helix domain-containing protein [Candidatus Dormibacteraeota bacterium]|nr:helix-hairpin-helix domain-containing protein [Candidatus Dormibacteraeota bacterium]